MKKKVIIWTTGIDNLLKGHGMVSGIAVQMMNWANVFFKNKWQVISLTDNKTITPSENNEIKFHIFKKIRFLNIIFEFFNTCIFIAKHKPHLIITRGASRQLFAISLFSKLMRIKLILMFASDSDLINGKELIARPWDRWLFRLGLLNVSNFVVQNSKQEKLLRNRSPKSKLICIPNIWPYSSEGSQKRDIILWVSNFRELKRPKWFIDLARELPNLKFVMVGGALDQKLFEECKKKASYVHNLQFLGSCSLPMVNALFERATLFVCTSEMEGFPNTFLQAWSNKIPVITTFDPSNLIQCKNLGVKVNSIGEAIDAINYYNNISFYNQTKNSITSYFEEQHLPQTQYQNLVTTFKIL
ncbi:glycosyltransferase family 4 protein [Arenibacter sp. M-2]|uniref:glycosyltransferase family 4 protein n=1 Tax=Arenibacter sp. M-2 TaxID=3053612 RepID=UPI0025711D5C|nr:glycosyltransferase family 4 protein [Arenibacter sp. M-2]MDL5514662.1 glycosyltransferase family 4 protein [Arenibacter sp. M-2]